MYPTICAFFVLFNFLEIKSSEDVFLAFDQNRNYSVCITNSSSAMSLIPASPHFKYDYVSNDNSQANFLSKINGKYRTNDSWEYKMSITDENLEMSDIVLDERWETFNLHYLTQRPNHEFSFQEILSLNSGDFKIPMSIRIATAATLLFCNEDDPYNTNCYWFHLATDFVAIKKSLKTNSTSPYLDIRSNGYLSNERWSHFIFSKIDKDLSIEIVFGNGTKTSVLQWTDAESPIQVNKIFFLRQIYNQGLLKFHEVDYIYTTTETTLRLSENINPSSGYVCISLYVKMCLSCSLNLTLVSEDQTLVQKMFTTRLSSWQMIRFESEKINHSAVDFFLHTISTSQDKFWAIDYIRRCMKNEFRGVKSNDSYLTCQLMTDDNVLSISNNVVLSTTSCPYNTVGPFCVPCHLVFSECKSIKICWENKCYCSSGYFGPYCKLECPKGSWGHGCSQSCGKCSEFCKNFDGVCRSGCQRGYSGPKCDIAPLVFSNSPDIIALSSTKVSVQMNNFDYTNQEENDLPQIYTFQYALDNGPNVKWINLGHNIKFGDSKPEEIDNLIADTQYLVRAVILIDNKTIDGLNEISVRRFVTLCDDLTEKDVKIQVTSTTATISVEETGELCKYEINFKTGEGEVPVIENNRMVLMGLSPFMNYNITIKNKQMAFEKQFQTAQGVPGPVRDLEVYSRNNNSISLRWLSPYPKNGIFSNYRITCEVRGYTHNTTIEKQECKIWPDFHCTTLKNLYKNTQYKISVAAKNMEPDKYGNSVSVVAETKIDKSDPPQNITVKWVDTDVAEVHWRHPNHTYGDIQLFVIKIAPTTQSIPVNSKGLRFKHPVKLENYQLSYYTKVRVALSPSSEYRFTVTANNGMEGKPAYATVLTPPIKPLLKAEEIVVKSTKTSITLKLKLSKPEEKNYLYKMLIYKKNQISQSETTMLKQRRYSDVDLKDFDKVVECNLTNFDFSITIGSESQLEFCVNQATNQGLEPGTTYDIVVSLTNSVENQSSRNFYHGVYRTMGTDGSNLEYLALLILFLLLPIGIVLFMKRRQVIALTNRVWQQTINDNLEREDSNNILLPMVAPTNLPPDVISIQPKIYSKKVDKNLFLNYVKESILNGELERQFRLFPRGQTMPWNYGMIKENKPKNRYSDLIAYDHSRVVLKKNSNDPFSDYINANYIEGINMEKDYIATQGPKSTTLNDFWRMIWQKNVKYIAMIANIVENGKTNVEQYWPEVNESLTFEKITVHHISNQVFADFVCRTFSLKCNEESRPLTQIHFTSWPDHGIPLYSQSLIPFLNKMLNMRISSKSPLVVHCSAGVGRTGTIILCDICLRIVALEGYIDVLQTLKKLRENRPNMVDNIEQYKLAHLVILEYLEGTNTGISYGDLERTVTKMLKDGSVQDQFNYLKEIQWQDTVMKTVRDSEDNPVIISDKNRFQRIIPEEQGRVFISRYPVNDETSSYINAVKVDGFRFPGRFIVTQQPLPHTISDFWRLIDEFEISVVLSLNEINLQDKTSCRFWPTENHPKLQPVDYINLLHTQSSSSDHYTVTKIMLTSNTTYRQVTIVAAKSWLPNVNCPSDVNHLLHFWQEADVVSRQSQIVAVTCYDGVRASGLYTALSFIIEKMKLEQICDVCQAVRVIRHNRPEFLEEEEQFGFLYKAAVAYIQGFQSYSNFQ